MSKDEMTEEEFNLYMMNDIHQEMVEEEKKTDFLNNTDQEFVKNHINYEYDLIEDILGGSENWKSEGFVEVIKTEYKSGSYPNRDFFVELDSVDGIKYMKQDESESFHNLVYQQGDWEDSYYGYLLFPINTGKYWKISFIC